MDNINVKRDILRDISTLFSGLLKQSLIAKSTALATSLVIKPGPGTLYKLVVYNDAAGAQYIQLYDSATLPANGVVPVITFSVATKGIVELPIHNLKGLKFSTGIVAGNSSTAATKTIGSADCWFHAIYI
jgi:hypothetical protein